MCYAILEIKYTVDKQSAAIKKVASKAELDKEIRQLELLGTVARVTVFLNHHTRKLVSTWSDELYRDPVAAAAE